jgi:caffeoyl-CoA O-methyltransferase
MDQKGRIRHETIDAYLESLRPEPDPILRRMEQEAEREGVPILDRDTSRLLSMLVRLGGLRRVLEIGTAIGYSTLHMARQLPSEGRLVTVDISLEMHDRARSYLEEAGVADRVRLVTGPALEVMPGLLEEEAPFDLLFLDAVKEEYAEYLDLALPHVRRGGVVAADNLLWMGQTAGHPLLDESYRASTDGLRRFNATFFSHPELLSVLVPVGDGAGIALKL